MGAHLADTIGSLMCVVIMYSRQLTVQAVASDVEMVVVPSSISSATKGLDSPTGASRRPGKQSAPSETPHSSRTGYGDAQATHTENGTGPSPKSHDL